MWPPQSARTLKAAASMVLLVVVAVGAVAGQRTSPQFSFPSPNQANQFGTADLFGTNNQDLSLLSSSGRSPSSMMNSAGQQSSFVALGAPQSVPQPLPMLQPEQPQFIPAPPQPQPHLVSQAQQSAAPQQQPKQLQPLQQQQPQAQPQEQPSIQVTRPSLSLTSLSLPQQQQQSTIAVRPTLGQQLASSQPSSRHHPTTQRSAASSNHHPTSSSPSSSSATSTSPSTSSSSSSSSSSSQSVNSQQHTSVESARKFEANSASLAASSGATFNCPDSFGFFRHHKSCDKYWACENGTATLKLCGNGLMFDDSDPKRENCAYPFSVECGSDRTDLEPPISTPNCPRLYGLFSDTANCRVFYSCWNGEASKYECPPGLAYDSEQRVCVWADLVDRCDQSEVSDGFVCPDPTEVDQPGHYTRHAHPTDCRKFYVCIDNVARPYGCSFGTVFNVDSLQCDEPENVSGCEKYYGDLDPKLAKKLARENAQQSGNVGTSSASLTGRLSQSSSQSSTTAATSPASR